MSSTPVINTHHLALSEGIRSVGIGKKGSIDLTEELCLKITEELSNISIISKYSLVVGGFLAGLLQKKIAKGLTKNEDRILKAINVDIEDSLSIVNYLIDLDSQEDTTLKKETRGNDKKLSTSIHALILSLAENKKLTQSQAEEISDFLFAENKDYESLKSFALCIFRLRYETELEWRGLADSALKKTSPVGLPTTKKIIQFSEPFNGFTYCHHLTPLLGYELEKNGQYKVVHSIGENSGPKYNANLLDILNCLPSEIKQYSNSLTDTPFGTFVKQSDINSSLDQWVERRHQLIKRPFMATLEKFVPTVKDIFLFVSSAFHPPYYEKMISLAEYMGYQNIVIQKLGLEGGIGVTLHRKTKYMVSQKQKDGTYSRKEWIFNPADYFDDAQIQTYQFKPKTILSAEEQKKDFLNYLEDLPTNPILKERVNFTADLFKKILRTIPI